ncbi:MAG TPA: tRNA (guanosine(37)-N1)-methyltransferase TrmD [Leptospiraceae bacterium]|nr:tRNA (guanosine(37)-N1)-methyltransferase TrmD [Leptospiraceae bacterium]HMX31655.1 tRNA (guanosine(37)-N1)-methyltransferase TrmD [Leptospiraceae bacterium]HMY30460.1 tRNA (guanosine(37)-N1)-methyltransferase TrmD [Leptospiraceae bacterium]HMZ66655.1 tRNA (guanosine(37)-N1)-methyltransferase TrmD [Leptospiraceae bacterium]HNA06467.1 tRNA (guanosine(37)-N1)-methyltransferase TrmD [Leptospiraceae bacterium]
MQINFITLFPQKIQSYFQEGLPAKAIEKGVFQIKIIHLRDFSSDKFGRVDDTVYGGGPGMLLKVEPIHKALLSLGEEKGRVCLMSPSGTPFTQQIANDFANKKENLTFISGYYEGIDHRVTEHLVDIELSLGNYVLSSGDLPSLCVSDSVIRLLPGFMGDSYGSLVDESHNKEGQLEYPQYTKPQNYNNWLVPEVLISGNHLEIAKWKEKNRKHIMNERK